ncbi:MAG: cyclic nucleotide-binding domain-containing protein [Verrucomicrobiales bacterium]|nr:cyclic nucleotide-binding domain-containing protein [Verrucomicrobiae bacterium]
MNPDLPSIGITEFLTDDERSVLSGYGEFVPVQADQVLIAEGQAQDSLYLLVSGKLEIFTEQDRRINLGDVTPGQCVGEVNMFDPKDASASVAGEGFSQVWRIDRSQLEEFMGENPIAAAKFLIGIASQLSKRVRQANDTLTSARDAVPMLVERLKEAREVIIRAQEELPKMISMI